jgi:hypothetical protein
MRHKASLVYLAGGRRLSYDRWQFVRQDVTDGWAAERPAEDTDHGKQE